MEHSICYGVISEKERKLLTFARVMTDYAVTYYICDVIVDVDHRGLGLSRMIMDAIEHARNRGPQRRFGDARRPWPLREIRFYPGRSHVYAEAPSKIKNGRARKKSFPRPPVFLQHVIMFQVFRCLFSAEQFHHLKIPFYHQQPPRLIQTGQIYNAFLRSYDTLIIGWKSGRRCQGCQLENSS